jgi:glycosyltransferase involved in cell wall biosynthesis
MAQADVVVVPSLADEPFGNTAVEALLAARPVIVSGAGGLLEAVEGFDSAQLVRPGDAAAIAAAIERVRIEWPAFRARASADAVVAADRHSPDRYGDRMAGLLAETIDARRGSSR